MANPYGGKNAREPENRNESQNSLSPSGMAAGAPLMVGSFSIDDAIAMHLVDCEVCRHAFEHLRPVAIGEKSALCATYWHLQTMRADYEGAINNIVAITEFGDEAPKGGNLQLWKLRVLATAIANGLSSIR